MKLPLSDQHLVVRDMARSDLFFLLTIALKRKDLVNQWLLDRCKEVEANPNGYLDLWARGHYKSTIITFALTIQDILSSHGDNPDPKWCGVETTIGLFSCTRPLAKQFLAQIKREFETNDLLLDYFPDILFRNPGKDAPMWSLDSGIVVKRKSNPKEGTIEAHGLVDGQPTSKHFFELVYDDVVTIESVRSTQMIEKTTEAWALSLNLGTEQGIQRYIGTRYHYNDTYKTIIDRGAAKPRIHTATLDGRPEGEPVLLSKETLAEKRRNMGPYVFSSQMLQNPTADETQGFKREWLNFNNVENHKNLNKYIVVDPANEKKKDSDYTVMMVLGLGADLNYYILDIIRDRLSLTERCETLFRLHRKYRPLHVGYEHYGMQADVAHIKDTMKRKNYHFKLFPLGGNMAKLDRIRRLIPLFEQGRVYLPDSCHKTNYEKKTQDLVEIFLNEEYLAFPVSQHDDMLDCLARILEDDLKTIWPKELDDGIYYEPESGSVWSV